MLAQQAFSISFPLMWEWEECDSFDVASGSTQILPSHHALKFAWGGHCIIRNVVGGTRMCIRYFTLYPYRAILCINFVWQRYDMYAQLYRLNVCGARPIMCWMHFFQWSKKIISKMIVPLRDHYNYALLALCRESDSLLPSPKSLKRKVWWCWNNFLVVQGRDLTVTWRLCKVLLLTRKNNMTMKVLSRASTVGRISMLKQKASE